MYIEVALMPEYAGLWQYIAGWVVIDLQRNVVPAALSAVKNNQTPKL